MADDDEFISRDYQSELADIAISRNSILYLPTGTGKTYIAILVIKRFIHELERPLDEGGKIVAILVNRVPLVEQTARVMARHLPVNEVGWYCGAMGVDNMTAEDWRNEFNTYKVVVMTAQILLDVIRTNKLQASQLAVLVLDECHHAIGNDPMSQLMQLIRVVPVKSQPRILGMSATLLNSNVPLNEVIEHIKKLEANLSAKVVTSCKGNVAKYSTKAVVRFETYRSNAKTRETLDAIGFLQNISFEGKFNVDCESKFTTEDFFHPLFNVNKSIKFPSLKRDIEKSIEDIGVYAGSKTVLNCICLLEKTALLTKNESALLALRRLICDLTAVRQQLSEKIFRGDTNVILKNSSSKFQTLAKVLKDHYDSHMNQSDSSESSTFCALVFVTERLTAKILWSVLEDLSRQPGYYFIRPEFVVGTSNDPRDSLRSSLLSVEWNSEVLRRFSTGAVNVLVSSNVLEEGIDIPNCNVVICYDEVKAYRSYIQAQGRARHEKSTFVVMLPSDSPRTAEYKDKINQWESQRKLVDKAVHQDVGRGWRNVTPDVDDEVPPYETPSGARLTLGSAIPTLNRYCMSLSTRDYFFVSPFCRETRECDKATLKMKFIVELRMPIPCPFRKPVQGKMSNTLKGAKRLAAFELCKQLHQIDELSDSLHPKKDSSLLHLPRLFPHWDSEKACLPTSTQSMHLETYPECMNGELPEEGEFYLHLLKITPSSDRPREGDNRKTVYFDMLASDFDYAIVSQREMPKVCEFPLFAPGVDLSVHVVPSAEKVVLRPEELKALFAFHSGLFVGPVPVVRPYMIFDRSCDKNSFVMAPVKAAQGKVEILWDIVFNYTTLPDVCFLNDEQRRALKLDPKDYECAILKPWYRHLLSYEVYLVAEVCMDMDAESAFPTEEYETFYDYFAKKYHLQLFHTSLPLLEVRHIYTKVGALTPRVQMKKKRWDKDCDECREHMVPELCTILKFPSALWVKGTFIPSALHRLHRLLAADELRRRIDQEANVGYKTDGVELNALVVDPSTMEIKEKKDFTFISTKHGLGKGSIKLTERRQAVQSRKPWGVEQEPVDISRTMDTLNIMEVAYYEQFIRNNGGIVDNLQKKKRPDFSLPADAADEIELLSLTDGNYGPQMNEIFQAINSKVANEIQHQERLTILGRAVMRMAATLYLYFSFANLPAGKLQWVVSKLTSDHNLAFCGMEKNIQCIVKVQDFACDCWRPPLFRVPSILEEPIVNSEVKSSILNAVQFEPEEQRTGNIQQDTLRDITELLQDFQSHGKQFGEYEPRILDHQAVSFEDLAETVNALIGLYYKTNGLEGAMKLITWFKLLPKDCVGLILHDIQMGDHKIYANVEKHLKCIGDLERRMQYKFRNRSYLLDALTHDSYIEADNEGQDRLSTVGYSILDFLLTVYIWEKFHSRDFEEQEELIAALTNQLTYAGLLVRYNLHRHILLCSSKLVDVIDGFVKYQDDRQHVIDEETFVRLTDAEVNLDEKPEAPCILAHTFAALVGAVYLDTYCDLKETWRFVYRFFKGDIEVFSKNIPRQPMALLSDLTPTPSFAKFETQIDTQNDRYITMCQIHSNGMRRDVEASGRTEAAAKNVAAKKAVNLLLFTPDD